ncbi:mosc domain containing protein [Grosmannia clavigera kw1407]|uniref:Mosc domain containing protein n=1 Tax=Grosmannia clavigera (strain kw1407 / UAMH 11150) TaxID=655863 RepID=F0XLH2_GROCL|nr:mosc domain containing protein [Grosmannia clavigera kw1407]EFX01259.1 mosc domain containing protein [Grosmannia clavigera kw1407]
MNFVTMKVTELYVYPVKGLRGIPVLTATIGPQGVRHDRHFMLMTSHRCKTGFTKMQLAGFPECALFSQELDGDSVVVRYHPPDALQGPTTMSPVAPPPLRIPLDPSVAELATWPTNLHGSPATGCRMGETYDAWFRACFGFDVLLVYIGSGQRPVLGETLKPKKRESRVGGRPNRHLSAWLLPALLPGGWLVLLLGGWLALLAYVAAVTGVLGARLHGSGSPTDDPADPADPWLTFTDCAPLLVTSEASGANMSARMSAGMAVPMYKFRPNIVVDGEAAWSEDFWAELQITSSDEAADGQGNHVDKARDFRLLLTSNCARCTSLNVDYGTGAPAAGELGEVLKRLSKDRRVDTGIKYSPVFGRYAFLDGSRDVVVAVGDSVDVVRRNKERTVWDWPSL